MWGGEGASVRQDENSERVCSIIAVYLLHSDQENILLFVL